MIIINHEQIEMSHALSCSINKLRYYTHDVYIYEYMSIEHAALLRKCQANDSLLPPAVAQGCPPHALISLASHAKDQL